MDRTQELTLLLKAKNMAGAAVDSFRGGLDGVADKARAAGRALEGMGRATAVGLGMVTETLLSGGGVGQAAVQLGVHIASELTETFGEQAIAKFTGSGLMAALTAPLAGLGATIGGMISAAIPVGMALLPVLLIGALIAAVAVLVLNPEIRQKVIDFAAGLGQKIVSTIGPFIGQVVGFFLGIPGKLVELGANIVRTIVGGLVSLPGKIADVVRQAFAGLKIDIGPFHITGQGITIDLPKITAQQNIDYHTRGIVPHYATGGWAGLRGPELALLGERGPEFVVPNSQLGGLGGNTIILQIGALEVARVLVPTLSRELAYELDRASPTTGRV